MGPSDHPFEPPARDAAQADARHANLPPRLQTLLQQAGFALVQGDRLTMQHALSEALAIDARQPDVLYLYAQLLLQTGNQRAAIANFESALRAAPADAMGYWQFARTLDDAGDVAAALAVRRRAVAAAPDSPLAWADLGEHLFAHGGIEESATALARAVALAPDYPPAQFNLGNAYVALGRTEEAAAALRAALQAEPAFGAAWRALVDIKAVAISDTELNRMRELTTSPKMGRYEHTELLFALGLACERAGRHREAWDRLVLANARRKQERPLWSRAQFESEVRKSMQMFERSDAAATDPTLGDNVVFVAGMPRSGTSLAEQILAAHPEVHGAGELRVLPQVLADESEHLNRRYPRWVPQATAEDWERLGRRYLDETAPHRAQGGVSTDKLPNNWRLIGAIRAMLPGAHIVLCRRDPLENCWSCFKQYFTERWDFTSDLDDLAVFWLGFEQVAAYWSARAPQQVHVLNHEALIESPESEIRALLAFCGLPYDAACLRFHESQRVVETLSAAQVREPIHRHRAMAAEYGALLNPLREALGLPIIEAVAEHA